MKTLVRMCEKESWTTKGCDKVMRLVAMPEAETTQLGKNNFQNTVQSEPRTMSAPHHEYSDRLYHRIEESHPAVMWPHLNPPPAKDAPEPPHPRTIYQEAQRSEHNRPPNAVLDGAMHAEGQN